MMAKMFYTLDEAKSALGRNEEEIKQLAREGRLREFRDGPRLMFKADQVEQLKNEMGRYSNTIIACPRTSGTRRFTRPARYSNSTGASAGARYTRRGALRSFSDSGMSKSGMTPPPSEVRAMLEKEKASERVTGRDAPQPVSPEVTPKPE